MMLVPCSYIYLAKSIHLHNLKHSHIYARTQIYRRYRVGWVEKERKNWVLFVKCKSQWCIGVEWKILSRMNSKRCTMLAMFWMQKNSLRLPYVIKYAKISKHNGCVENNHKKSRSSIKYQHLLAISWFSTIFFREFCVSIHFFFINCDSLPFSALQIFRGKYFDDYIFIQFQVVFSLFPMWYKIITTW